MAVGWRLAARFRASRPPTTFSGTCYLILGQGLPDSDAFKTLRHPGATACCGTRAVSSGVNHCFEGVAEGGVQEVLWQKFFSDPTQWWDYRRRKETPQHPDFRHKKSKEALWLQNWSKPSWVDLQLAMLDTQVDGRMRRPLGSFTTSVQRASGRLAVLDGDLEAGTCRKLCEDGHVSEAVEALNLLVQRGCHPDNNLFYCLLKRCIAQKDLVLGRRIHALSVESGYEGDAFLATHLIGMYASHARLEEALRVFSKVSVPDAYMWASIILTYAKHGEPNQAIGLYRQMRESNLKPDNRIFVAVLKACASAGDIAAGKDVHTHILASPGKPDIFVQNSLVHMYAKCGSLEDARRVFDSLPHKNVVTWNAMIAGYSQPGMGQGAMSLYNRMQQEGITLPDPVTFVSLLQACAGVGVAALHQGQHLHAQIEERGFQSNVVVGNSLVNMYAKCGSLEDAQKMFERLCQKDVVTWTALIAGYAQQGIGQEALSLYSRMKQEGITPPDSFTFVCLLQACASVGGAALHQGEELHTQIQHLGVRADVIVGASLVNMYAKCGSLEDAQRVFDTLSEKNVVTWTALIAGYVQQGMGQKALSLYSCMQQEGITPPDPVTFVCLLQACASVGAAALHQAKQVHAHIKQEGVQADVVVGASLVNVYAKCGSLEDAQRVFDNLSHKNVVTWTAMIAGYAQQGMGQEALSLYTNMQQGDTNRPDSVTFICLLQACASVAALPLGKQLHGQIQEQGLQADLTVGCNLVNMYAKCGSLEDARQVFDSLPERESVAWGALIAGYARTGDSESVFDLVRRMREDGIEPDGSTLLSVLTVCSHVGLLDQGQKYFKAMSSDYGIGPSIEHYTCMVDLLGRAGQLDEALAMVKAMPFQPDSTVWHTLLAACRKWTNVEVGLQAFEFAVRLDIKDSAAYVLMSNIYADAKMWEESKEMQVRRVKCGAWKEPGRSWWTDKGGVMHSFVVR